MKHKFLVEVETDGRYDSIRAQNELMDLVAGRCWNINGVVPHGASATLIQGESTVVSKKALDQREQQIGRLENALNEARSRLGTFGERDA